MIIALVFFALIGGMIAVTPKDMYPDKQYPHLTVGQVKEYRALENALVDGGRDAIIQDASKSGCFDRIKIVNGKEVKQCWGAMRPAGRDSKWECEELSRREAPQCYEEANK